MKREVNPLKINWKLRFQNPAFWIFVGTVLISNFATGLNVNVADLTTWSAVWQLIYHSILNPTVLVPTLVSLYFGAVDYTSKGISDSEESLNKTSL